MWVEPEFAPFGGKHTKLRSATVLGKKGGHSARPSCHYYEDFIEREKRLNFDVTFCSKQSENYRLRYITFIPSQILHYGCTQNPNKRMADLSHILKTRCLRFGPLRRLS